jgi:HAD superfamily hydrolase (TIGR01549 family)
MPELVLFDLDDTLLTNDMDVFLPAYFELVTEYARDRFQGARVKEALIASTHVMMSSPGLLNREAFWAHFAPQLGQPRDELERYFQEFYASHFHRLRPCTDVVEGAAEVIAWFRARGVRLVLATNPVYPREAILQRLDWAGLQEQDFELITSYENMHATKPDPAYYREILERTRVSPENTWMVGNDWVNDIEPARAVGITTFYVASATASDEVRPGEERATLAQWLERWRALAREATG